MKRQSHEQNEATTGEVEAGSPPSLRTLVEGGFVLFAAMRYKKEHGL
jgi:hypothetical protein